MSSYNLLSTAHYDVTNQKLVEPLQNITFDASASNPGGNTTLWIRASDGALMLGSNPVTSSGSLAPKARIVHGGNYNIIPTTSYVLIATPSNALFTDYGISTGTLTNPSVGLIQYNGTTNKRLNVKLVLNFEANTGQVVEIAPIINGVVQATDYYLSLPTSATLVTFDYDHGATPNSTIGFALKANTSSTLLIRGYYLYVEIAN